MRDDQEGPFKIINPKGDRKRACHKLGEWNSVENAKYAAFLIKNAENIENKAYKELWVHFKAMAKFIQSRNTCQCKSHHQKLYNRF